MSVDDSFSNLCVFHILDGLREGLTHFTHPSRAALIYALDKDGPLRVYDPHDLLHGHEPKIREFYLDVGVWRNDCPKGKDVVFFEESHKQLDLSGIISFGGCSNSVRYQRWFTEQHPDLCSTGPIRHLLENAVRHLSQSFAARDVQSLDTMSHALQNCSIHAVRDYIVDRRNAMVGWDTQLRIYAILEAILNVSKTPEEGAWPRGTLVFVEPGGLAQMDFMAKFPKEERPSLANAKHVRKVLQSVERSNRRLVSDGDSIVGIAKGQIPETAVVAEFHGNYGFLFLGRELISSFSDGDFQNTNRRPNLVQVEEALLEEGLDPIAGHALFKIITSMVHSAMDRRHGCTLVVDLKKDMVRISGQKLEKPLDLQNHLALELACSLAKMDGALHIGADLKLHSFACLLDGVAVPGESRARGARFNSAVRFTAKHDDLIVVVVSADRPVSIIQRGMELTAACRLNKHFACVTTPPTIEEWLGI